MLRAASKGTVVPASAITPEEDRLLRAAFGRYGGRADARADAAAVVARYQQRGAGCWFLCDCLPGAERPPALVLVTQTFIRRHGDTRWPAHCESCDFYQEQEEQRLITASYARPSANKPLRLALPLSRTAAAAPAYRLEGCSRHTARPGIARLLIQLVTEAGLQSIEAGWRAPPLVDQVKAIWTAAKLIEIDAGVRLPEFLCTSSAKLGGLVAKIEAARPGRFKQTRPHGVLVVRLAAAGAGVLQPISGKPIPVKGRLAVFGERPGAGRETNMERTARAPYLAACVIGRAREDGPVEVLSAYAHPCAGDAHLMLLDSDMERRTLAQLRSLQGWLADNRRMPVSIEKPMYDLAGDTSVAPEPLPPCIPDFVVRSTRPDGAPGAAIVETMGFADDAYRARKERIHPLMSAVLDGAPVVMHDFHEPAGRAQKWRDDLFWHGTRQALTRAIGD